MILSIIALATGTINYYSADTMKLPALLPEDMLYCEKAVDDEQLWNLLYPKPDQLVRFFDYACDDETWTSENTSFISKALTHLTKQFFWDRLHIDLAKVAARAIREHFNNLKTYLPFNLTFKLKDQHVEINSLLFQTASPFLHAMIRINCHEKNRFWLTQNDVLYNHFKVVEEFVNTGEIKELWNRTQKEMEGIMYLCLTYGLDILRKECETILKRYITRENLFETLAKANRESLEILQEACFEMFNKLGVGLKLSSKGPQTLVCEFQKLTELSSENFKIISPLITHLICGPTLTEEKEFGNILKSCPKMISLDLSQTKFFSEQLEEIPVKVIELNFFNCAWLSNANLRKIIEICPQVQRLDLTSCGQINSTGWGDLIKLKDLIHLNVSRCLNMTDLDLAILLNSCPSLTHLTLSECRRLSDKGFHDISTSRQRLTQLNVGRTQIGDTPLIELASRMSSLQYLDLTRCANLTELGINEAIKNAAQLREINITHCNIPEAVVDDLRKQRPYLKIIFD